MKSKRISISNIVNYTLLTILSFTFMYPILYMFSVSISDFEAIGFMKVKLFPVGFQLEAYETVFNNTVIMRAAFNSILYTTTGVVIGVIVAALAGYALAHTRYKSIRIVTFILSLTLFIKPGLIPQFLNIVSLGLIDTMWSFILFPATYMWYIILMRTSFKSIPSSLIESAYIDGANEWYIFFKIVMPLSKAIIATIAIFMGVLLWNNYMGPLLYLTSDDKQTLTIILKNIMVSNLSGTADTMINSMELNIIEEQGRANAIKMATVFVTVGPVVVIYPFAQKYFVKGVMVGAIKG